MRSQPRLEVAGGYVYPPRQGINLARKVNGDIPPPFPLREEEAVFREKTGKGLFGVCRFPALLEEQFQGLRVFGKPDGLKVLRFADLKRVATPAFLHAFRHFPAVFEEQGTGYVHQLELVVGNIDADDPVGMKRWLEPQPDDMAVAAAFLFVEDDDAGLVN